MKLRSVQALRALAALAVLICHLHAIENTKALGTPLLSSFWVTGAAGVDLFFVISGFIMVWVAGESPQQVTTSLRFLFARASRIYPLWWLFAALMSLYFLVTYGQAWDPIRVGSDPSAGFDHLLKSFFLVPQAEHPVLGVGWTLVHEMYFYVVFALILCLVPRAFRLVALTLWGASVTAGALLGLSGPVATSLVELVFYPMSLEFLMGAWVAYAVRHKFAQRLAPLTALLGGLALILVFTLFDFETGGTLLAGFGIERMGDFTLGWGRTLFFGVPCALLLHGLVNLERTHTLGRYIPNIFVSIGDWSYALYLSHIMVLSAVARIYFPLVGNVEDQIWDNIGFLILSSLTTIVFSGIVYRTIEQPIIRWYQSAREKLFPSARKLPSS